jgi:hypothetical protein
MKVHFREAPPSKISLRSTIALPDNTNLHSFAISPDSRYVAIAAESSAKRQLWLRALDTLQAQLLTSTDDAAFPFWHLIVATSASFPRASSRKSPRPEGQPNRCVT